MDSLLRQWNSLLISNSFSDNFPWVRLVVRTCHVQAVLQRPLRHLLGRPAAPRITGAEHRSWARHPLIAIETV